MQHAIWIMSRICFQYKQGVQRTTTPLSPPISERIAHSWANKLETVRVSYWPITWPIYLSRTVAQSQSHCASNIISNSQPFHSSIPEIHQCQYFTLTIQGQGHGWGQSWKSQHRPKILPTHIPFVSCQSAIPFLRYNFFKIYLENPRSRSLVRWTLKLTAWVQHYNISVLFQGMRIA